MAEVRNNEIIISKKEIKNSKRNSNFTAVSPIDTIKKNIDFAVKRDGGKYIDAFETKGILIAGTEYNGDYGFVIINADRNVEFVPSTTRYKLIREVPINLSVLDYVYTHNGLDLKERAEYQLNEDKNYNLTTDIVMHFKTYHKPNKKNFKKNSKKH